MRIKNRKIVFFINFMLFFLLINGLANVLVPEKPKTVPEEAKWENGLCLWSFGDRLDGNKILWYKDGTCLYREILVKPNLKKSKRYHENGIIHKIGQWQYFKDRYFDNDGNLIGWIEIGRWKEYDREGILIHEWCLTPNPNRGGEEPQKCGVENYYNKDGKIQETINHKLKCDYGCEELECKDCIKK